MRRVSLAAELAALRRFYRWARSEGLRPDDPSQGIRPPRREPYSRARGLSTEEVAWLWRDLDLEGGFYRYTAKGGKERQRALPPPVNWAIQPYAQAAGLARKPEEAVFPGRWRDQPVDGKYIGEQLRQAADLAVHRRRNRYSQTSKVTSRTAASHHSPPRHPRPGPGQAG